MMLNTQVLIAPSESTTETDNFDSSKTVPSNKYASAKAPPVGVPHKRGQVDRPRSSSDTTFFRKSDPWSRTLAALQQFSDPSEVPLVVTRPKCQRGFARTASDETQIKTFTVTILEHMANSRVCLSWHDPTLCNYEEQVWAPALARRTGRCALSGAHIGRGDPVYRPQIRGGRTPANSDAMILASALKRTGEA
ncbi:DUF3331 domain-containing protein [Caballeronia sp. 15711]|uniref:DUF3331 domain-containing protein n=1 Tax=Caballeronia sp. 15711 TaxID=3391029 RepID=UPI0039E59421